jgi:HEAT repeat protein
MTDDIRNLLGTVENGTRKEIWEAAKQLESVSVEMVLSLLRLLESGEQTETRAAAAYVLGFGRFASARTALEQVLDDTEEEASVRGHAAEALAYIQSRESVDVLLKHLEDRNPGVTYWCTFALGKIGSAKAVPVLGHLADRVGDQLYEKHSLRAEALDAIAEINQHLGKVAPNGDG